MCVCVCVVCTCVCRVWGVNDGFTSLQTLGVLVRSNLRDLYRF